MVPTALTAPSSTTAPLETTAPSVGASLEPVIVTVTVAVLVSPSESVTE